MTMRHAIVSLMLVAAFCTGETNNLIYNSRMVCTSLDGRFPDGWSPTVSSHPVLWKPTEDGRGRIACFVNRTGASGVSCSVRAYSSLRIVPGEAYRFRLKIRTRDFHCGAGGFVAFGPGWNGSFGIEKDSLPANTGWTTIEKVCLATTGRGSIYSFAIYANNFTGELEVAKPEILPDSGKAQAEAFVIGEAPPLQPVSPPLSLIPAGSRTTLTFRDYSSTLGPIRYALSGQPKKSAFPEGGLYRLELGALAPGRHRLDLECTAGHFSYPLTAVPPAPTPQAIVWRNNFHRELGEVRLAAGKPARLEVPEAGIVRFSVPQGCQVAVHGTACGDGESLWLPAGVYDLSLTGSATATVRVSLLTETLLYPLANGPLSCPGLKPLDWEHARRHLLPAYTTFVARGDHITEAQLKALLAAGHHRMYASVGMAAASRFSPGDADAARRFFVQRASAPTANGVVIVDEIENNIPLQTQWFRELFADMGRLPDETSLHIWLCGGSVHPDARLADFLQTASALSRDMRHHYEVYLPSERTEREARLAIADKFRQLSELLGMAPDSIGATLCYCNLPFGYCLDIHPGVNFKYFLDLQLHALANDPQYRGLKVLGFWGDHYADREMSRFAAALLRHYVHEGRTDLFTARLGYTYRPGHLDNPDFEWGLDGWLAQGDVAAVTAGEFGKNWQRRITDGREGDCFAQFRRGAGAADTLAQRATGLVPGKVYSLSFVSGDAARLRQTDHRKGVLACTIQGAEVLPEYTEHSLRDARARGNYDKIVFRALVPDPLVTFSDAGATPGTRVYLNHVSLMPYYTGEE